MLPTFPQAAPLDVERLRTTASAAEAAGVDALWACDHLFWHGPVLEALTALAVVAGATSDCVLGTAVLQLPLRPPAVVAKSVASLQLVTGGRVVLGVGAGAHEGEFAAAGVDFATRGRALDAGLDQLERLWTASDERYHQQPAPSPVPVWIGGSGDRALGRAARRGDGWIPMFVPPETLRERYAVLDAEAILAGRRPEDVARALLVFVHVDPRPGVARQRGGEWMSTLYRLPADRLHRHLIAGDVDECVDRLAAYVDAGVQHLCLFVADDDPLPHVTALLDRGLRAVTRTPDRSTTRTVHS